MADYNTLQQAIDAGTSNMVGEDYYSKSIGDFPIAYYIAHYVNLKVKTYPRSSYMGEWYPIYEFGDYSASGSKFVFGDESYYFTLEDNRWLDENGYINGNRFYRVRVKEDLDAPASYGEEHEIFFFPVLMKFYVHFITPMHNSSKLVAGSETVTINYTFNQESEFTFSCEDKINGLGWSAEAGKPDLPEYVPDPGPPTPTVPFTFVNGKKYRVRIRTKYKKLNTEDEVYSNYCDEFIGHKIPQRYIMYGGAIDLSDMSVWDPRYTNQQETLLMEGDYKGFHYKHYVYMDRTWQENGVTIITGKQTEAFNSWEEWPFNDNSVDPSSQTPAYWGVSIYFDGEITDFGNMFYCRENRFFTLPDELTFGKNAKFPKITTKPFRGISTYPMIYHLDNLSDTEFELDANGVQLFSEWVYFDSDERNDKFLANIKFSNNVTSIYRMFYRCSDLTKIDTSKWTAPNALDIQALFESCGDLSGLIDLKGLTINGSLARTFYYTDVEEVQFSSSGNVVTSLSETFRSCQFLKRVDLSGFSTPSSGVIATRAFAYCSKLEYLDLSTIKLNTGSASNYTDMLTGCTSLKEFFTPKVSSIYRSPTFPVAMYDVDDPTDVYEAGETIPCSNIESYHFKAVGT